MPTVAWPVIKSKQLNLPLRNPTCEKKFIVHGIWKKKNLETAHEVSVSGMNLLNQFNKVYAIKLCFYTVGWCQCGTISTKAVENALISEFRDPNIPLTTFFF